MTEQQYKRASKKVFLVVAIVYGYVILTMLAYLGANKDASVGKTILQLITAAAVIAVSAFANAAKGGTRQGAIMICTSLAAGYVVIMLVNSTSGTWAYALPMLLSYVCVSGLSPDGWRKYRGDRCKPAPSGDPV